MPTNNLSPCTGIVGELITDVSIDVTEETAHSLATNADLSKIREAKMRNHGNGGDSGVKGEGYDHTRLFTDARIEAEANDEDADIDRGLEEDEDNFLSPVGSSQVRTQRGRDHLQERRTKESQRGKMRIIPASGRSTHIALHTFNGDGTYQYHEMPSGATPVPIKPKTGKRTMNDWEFFCDGWDHPIAMYYLIRTC